MNMTAESYPAMEKVLFIVYLFVCLLLFTFTLFASSPYAIV